jgi:thioredoxin-related protein
MLFREAVAVYCENHTENTDTVRTSQETHYVSATEHNRLMLFRETVAVYCENHTKNTDTVRTSQETHVSATDTNRLMLFGETVAVYCENQRERKLGVVVRDTTIEGGSETIIFDLKVLRHCPLVLLIRMRLEY